MNSSDPVDFDPYLGMATADSWWLLGRRLAPFHRDEPEDRKMMAAERWIGDLLKERDECYDDEIAALTPERLRHFAEDVYVLLERKFHGEAIGAEVIERLRASADFDPREKGQYLDLFEPVNVWWANEYRALFLDLVEPKSGPSWLYAVDLCANERCRRFFVKQRSDHRFHAESCRSRAANQRSYQKRKTRAHKRP